MTHSPLTDLIHDTSTFFQTGFFFDTPLSLQKVKTPPPQLVAPPKVMKKAPPPEKPVEKQPTPVKKPAAPPRSTLMEKHLPHVEFLAETPPPPQVAILVADREDLPFLKGLASAIQSRFCPVKLLDTEVLKKRGGVDAFFSENRFSLILSREELSLKEQVILLASIETYQKNTDRKKELWSSICQKLSSPKSS